MIHVKRVLRRRLLAVAAAVPLTLGAVGMFAAPAASAAPAPAASCIATFATASNTMVPALAHIGAATGTRLVAIDSGAPGQGGYTACGP